MGKYKEKVCEICGEKYLAPNVVYPIFCSPQCGRKANEIIKKKLKHRR